MSHLLLIAWVLLWTAPAFAEPGLAEKVLAGENGGDIVKLLEARFSDIAELAQRKGAIRQFENLAEAARKVSTRTGIKPERALGLVFEYAHPYLRAREGSSVRLNIALEDAGLRPANRMASGDERTRVSPQYEIRAYEEFVKLMTPVLLEKGNPNGATIQDVVTGLLSSKFYESDHGGVNRLSGPILAMADWSLSKADSQSFNLNWASLFRSSAPMKELVTEQKVSEYLTRYLKDFGHEPTAYSTIDSGIDLAGRLREAKASGLSLDSVLKQVMERVEGLTGPEKQRAAEGLRQYQTHLEYRRGHSDFAPSQDNRALVTAFVVQQSCEGANAKVAPPKK